MRSAGQGRVVCDEHIMYSSTGCSNPSRGFPAGTPAEELAKLLALFTTPKDPIRTVASHRRHRRPLHANMPPMHATTKLTWCCRGKTRATKEQQKMRTHSNRVGQHGHQAQVESGVVCNEYIVACINIQQWRTELFLVLLTPNLYVDSADCTQTAVALCRMRGAQCTWEGKVL